MIWKDAVTPLNNATDKNWISVEDTPWTKIIKPYAQKIYNIRPKLKNCKPGENLATFSLSLQHFQCIVTSTVRQ